MFTRCPHPDCNGTFEHADDLSLKSAKCSLCAKPMLLRPLNILTKMDERAGRIADQIFSIQSVRDAGSEPLIVIAEDVRSLWNVGSIFRTADGAGVSRLILCGITGSPPRKEIAKTSLGAEDTVPWNYSVSAVDVVLALKSQGYQIVGLEKSAQSRPLTELLANDKIKMPMCLAVGNEVTGLSAEVLHYCDIVCDLPMRGMKESLNVAVAFGIAAYAITEHFQALCPTRM